MMTYETPYSGGKILERSAATIEKDVESVIEK